MTPLSTQIQNAFELIDALGMAKVSLPEDSGEIQALIDAFGQKNFSQENLDQAKVYMEKMLKSADQSIKKADQEYDHEMQNLNNLRKELRKLEQQSKENIASI